MSDETTRLKDINDQIQELIVKSLERSTMLYIQGHMIEAFKAMKDLFWKIAPFDFKNKEYLSIATQKINAYIDEVERAGGKPDMRRVIEVNQKKSQLKDLIEEYFQIIPYCLRELNLYLRIIKKRDDPDELFSEETFDTTESLIDRKKKELGTVKAEDLLNHLTPRQLHDVHARLLTYKDMKGMILIED